MKLFGFLIILTVYITTGTLAEPYVRNSYVFDQVWNEMAPYFLPDNSPEKETLDKIFGSRRVLSSINSMNQAGFRIVTDPDDKIVVAKHPYLKGYLLKVYLDNKDIPEWDCFRRRVKGSKVIQQAIDLHGYNHIMKVPKKWIYPLPAEPSPTKPGAFRKDFVLLVEEIDILSYHKNRTAYKSKITPEILNAMYTMLTTYLLIDSVYSDNVPFCKDGRMAFVDTEYTGDTTRPVPLSAFGQYLSPGMLAIWEQLLVHGLPH